MTITTKTTALEILKQDRLGRVRTPRSKQEEILAEYDRSGMSGQHFAQYLGIKYQTFATWVQKRRKRRAGGLVVAAPQVSWVEAEVGGGQEMHTGKSGLVVEFGGGRSCGWEMSEGRSWQLHCLGIWGLGDAELYRRITNLRCTGDVRHAQRV